MIYNTKTVRTSKRLVHAIATCYECGWECDGYRVSARQASAHARKTKHPVKVEQGVVYTVKPWA